VAARARRDELVSERWAGRQPYRALATYGPQDAELFVGRERLVAELAARVLERRMVVVVGASGSGKSSLVRAGLVPLARSGRLPGVGAWGTHIIVPGSDPLAALDVIEELDEPRSRLLVVDQFEEALTSLPATLDRFCAQLLDLAGDPSLDVHVVLVIRSDQYTRLASISALTDAVTDSLLMVGPPSDDEVRRIVTEPARRTGVAVEPALVDLVSRDVGGYEAALPLVSAALSEAWERRDSNVLRAARYVEIGGLATAVERLGERAVTRAGESHIAGMRRILLMLADVTDDGVWTRRRVTIDELPDDREALAALVDARLVVRNGETVEITHEVVFRTWPRLVEWLEVSRNDLVLERDLRAAARAWDADGRTDDNLYRGARLHAALEWAERSTDGASLVIGDFLSAGRHHAERQEHKVREQLQRERQARRRVTWALGAAALLLAFATLAGATALISRNQTEKERRTATAREMAAASTASLDDDPERSVLLALAAVDETRSSGGTVLPESASALHEAVTSSRILHRFPDVGGTMDWSPDGTMFVTEGPEDTGIIDIRDAETGASIQSFHGHDPDVNDVSFSNDSSIVATTGDDGAVRVWNPRTGVKLFEYQGEVGGGGTRAPTFSPDDTMLALSWSAGVGRVIDLETAKVVIEIDELYGNGSSFSPDGRRIAVAGPRPRVIDVTTGDEVFPLGNDITSEAVWSPNGRSIVTVGDVEPVIWDATTGERRFSLIGHTAPALYADWSPDSSRVATASADGTARIWEIGPDGGRETLRFSGRDASNGLAGVAFSPDGTRLMTSDQAITSVIVWDASPSGGAEWANVPGADAIFDGADFTPDGGRVVLAASEGTLSVNNAKTGERLSTIGPSPSHAEFVKRFELSPDGQLLASSDFEGPVDLWDMSTGDHLLAVDTEPDAHVEDLDWSRDGNFLAISYDIGRFDPAGGHAAIKVVDRTGASVAHLTPDPGFWFSSVSFSPNLDQLVTTRDRLERDDPTTADLQLWDWQRGTLVRTVDAGAQQAVFDPTGTRIATVRWLQGAIDIWDADTGEHVAETTAPAQANDVAFSPDGALLASNHADGTTRLWNVESGVQVLVLQSDGDASFGVQFSPDASKLVTVTANGIARVWALDLDDLITIAHSRLTRRFSEDECRQYLHVEQCPDA
jgi:WD40 repeat protein